MLNFLIYSGSARVGNFTQHVARFALEVLSKRKDISAEIVSTKSIGANFENEGMEADYPQLREKVIKADGYLLVSPEYNHGYPGSMKYLLDLNLKEYIHKPVAFVGVSKGVFGGARGIELLVNVVRELGMVATFTDTNFSNVQDEITDGILKDSQKWEKRLNRTYDELIWMAETLKTGREQRPRKE